MDHSKQENLIDEERVTRVARLARLAPDKAERTALLLELNQILMHFNRLERLDTRDILPAYHPHDLENRLRDDVVQPSFDREELIGLTRNKDGCLLAPRTVE